MHLVCGSSTVLEIQAADFGESAALICGKSEESNQLCRLLEKTGIVKTRCDDKPQCYISALRSIFGDPCLGLNKETETSIYLNVMYACGKFTFSGRDCAQFLLSGKSLKITSQTEHSYDMMKKEYIAHFFMVISGTDSLRT